MHYSLTRATLWNLAGYSYLFLAALISTPTILQNLGVVEFGRYSLIVATTILVSSIDFGLPQAVVRMLVRSRKNTLARQTLWATSSLLFIISGVLSGVVAVLITLSLHLSPLTYSSIFLICLLNNLLGHYSTLPQAEGHFGYYNSKTFIVGTGNTLLTALVSSFETGVERILLFLLGTYLLTLIPLVNFSLKFLPSPRSYVPSLKVAKELINFGLKNQLGKIIGQVQSQYAKYLLAGLGALPLSSYVIAQGLVQKIAGGVAQLSSALYPASTIYDLKYIYYRLQLMLFSLGILGVYFYKLFGYTFLSWWLKSPEIVGLVDQILNILVIYFVVLILTPLASTILDGSGRPGITSLSSLFTTILEITITLFLLPKYGLLAPAYSALIAISITTPILLIVTNKLLFTHSQ